MNLLDHWCSCTATSRSMQVENKPRQLENDDIIERAEGLTSCTCAPKSQSRMKSEFVLTYGTSTMQAIIRKQHVIPTIDDVASDLNGCKVFSKIDLNQWCHQVLLYSDSRQLATSSTHVELLRYKQLNFGLSCAAEIFQKKVSDTINGIPCVKNISDGIYVGGKDKNTHDQHLKQVSCRLQENAVTINLPNCQFRVPTMLLFGQETLWLFGLKSVCHLVRRRLSLYKMLLYQPMPLNYEAYFAPLHSALGLLRTSWTADL